MPDAAATPLKIEEFTDGKEDPELETGAPETAPQPLPVPPFPLDPPGTPGPSLAGGAVGVSGTDAISDPDT